MNDWTALDRQHCWHPFTQHGLNERTLAVTKAQGAYLTLNDGATLIDGIGSWWCNVQGHGHPKLVEAMTRQASTLDHVLFAGCTHEPAARLAEAILSIGPQGLSHVFYSDNGSTAVEVALKMAFQYWLRRGEKKKTFVCFDGGYHGDTFGAMAVGDPDPFFADFSPLLFSVIRVPKNADTIAKVFAERDDIAALICEPGIQGSAGMLEVSTELLQKTRQLCAEHEVLFIADEIFTGFGKTGSFTGCQTAGIVPDLMCLGKGLNNGMFPISATVTAPKIYEAFVDSDRAKAFFHGHTMTANPIGCAIGLACIELYEQNDTANRYTQNAKTIAETILALGLPGHANIRTQGGVVAVDCADDSAGYLAETGARLRKAVRGAKTLLRPLGNVLYTVPPICVSQSDMNQIATDMHRAILQSL